MKTFLDFAVPIISLLIGISVASRIADLYNENLNLKRKTNELQEENNKLQKESNNLLIKIAEKQSVTTQERLCL